jgi:Sulfotransferase family
MALPDFLVIGAPKAGTTALHVALAGHPQVFMSPVKEPKFFLTEGKPLPAGRGPGDAATNRKIVWRRSDYEALFAAAPTGVRRGESTTLYLRNAEACRRISATIPDARLIAVLRDPIDRAHSNWTHLRSAGLEPEGNFLTACALEDQRRRAGWAQFWQYVAQGRYGEQLEQLYSLFPAEQVLLVMYRNLREEPHKAMDEICDFLGIERGTVPTVPAENVTTETSPSLVNGVLRHAVRRIASVDERLPGPLHRIASSRAERLLQREQGLRQSLSRAERAALIQQFDADIALLERITGRSFEHWRDPHNGVKRQPLEIEGRIGTGHRSIDRPVKPTN